MNQQTDEDVPAQSEAESDGPNKTQADFDVIQDLASQNDRIERKLDFLLSRVYSIDTGGDHLPHEQRGMQQQPYPVRHLTGSSTPVPARNPALHDRFDPNVDQTLPVTAPEAPQFSGAENNTTDDSTLPAQENVATPDAESEAAEPETVAPPVEPPPPAPEQLDTNEPAPTNEPAEEPDLSSMTEADLGNPTESGPVV